MTKKDFSDFMLSFSLNLDVDVNIRKISELVKIISSQSRECPRHLCVVNDRLTEVISDLTSYIDSNFVKDEEKH